MAPFFSVVITTHNAQATIERTLKSVVAQSFTNFEITVIDDYSTDNTMQIINNVLSPTSFSYQVIRLDENKGVSVARNIGIKKSIGRYIAFLDDDDLWLKHKLERQHKIILEKDLKWTFSNYLVVNNNYRRTGKRYRTGGFYGFKDLVSNGNPVGLLTVVISREVLLQYSFKRVHHEDYDLWLRLGQNGYVGYLDTEYLAEYMKSTFSTSGNKIKSTYWTYQVFRGIGISKLKATWYMINYLFNVFRRNKNL